MRYNNNFLSRRHGAKELCLLCGLPQPEGAWFVRRFSVFIVYIISHICYNGVAIKIHHLSEISDAIKKTRGRPQGCFFVAIFLTSRYNIYERKLSSTYTFFNIFYSILTLKQKDCRTLAVFLFCHFAVAMPAAAPSIKATAMKNTKFIIIPFAFRRLKNSFIVSAPLRVGLDNYTTRSGVTFSGWLTQTLLSDTR